MSRFQTGTNPERYHPTDDVIHSRRVAVIDWLEAAARNATPGNRADLDRLLTEADASAMIVDTVHPIQWNTNPFSRQGGTPGYPAIPGIQYSVPYENSGGRKRASTYIRDYWRNNSSARQAAYHRQYHAGRNASGAAQQHSADARANAVPLNILYITDVIPHNPAIAPAPFGPDGDWHTYAQTQGLTHNNYPGQWDGISGGSSYVTMRQTHFNGNDSKISRLLQPTPNDPIPADCLEMAAILCKRPEDRVKGEAWLLEYSDEINGLNGLENPPRPPPFLWSYPERGPFQISPADRTSARRLARQHYRAGHVNGLMYQMVPAGTPRHPPRWATYDQHLKVLPYHVRPKDVKLRWPTGSRPDCPRTNSWNPVHDAVALWGPPPP